MDELDSSFEGSYAHEDLKKRLLNNDLYAIKDVIVPKLRKDEYKGCSGKICVIGGSEVYSGAVYLSSISTLKIGGDLCFVITTDENKYPLKSYSCELIVYPYLYTKKSDIKEIENSPLDKCIKYLLERIDSCVVGPGLGEIDEFTEECLIYILEKFLEKNIFLILDADIIQVIMTNMKIFNLIKNYKNCLLTPNINELRKMLTHLNNNIINEDVKNIDFKHLTVYKIIQYAHALKSVLNAPKILIKGFHDTGIVSVFLCWASKIIKQGIELKDIISTKETFLSESFKDTVYTNTHVQNNDLLQTVAIFNASYFLKYLCKKCFRKNHRGLLASDVVNSIPPNFYRIYDLKKKIKNNKIKNNIIKK
ncbi:carbohydrate kinase family protein [Plasmodium falciparum IGH-CR14]|uniref:ATP-dependent (S)-NAD(P)H-hydrate dehydratase n=2 Tax=Plasmodium falciparum TaxID=5833 RepID=A0A0L0CWS9_PLAFA|nr:carbohydrate kinase family protein [Plasmodium falciparum RAJ116]KNG75984.1 carbohydrate kinase family protein [Plasmodium falciparum IGH-CR14]